MCRIQIWTSKIGSDRPAIPYTEVVKGPGMAALLHKIVRGSAYSTLPSLADA